MLYVSWAREKERERERERKRESRMNTKYCSEIEVQMALGLVPTERVTRRVNQREPIKTSDCNNTENMLLKWDVLIGSRWWREAWRAQWERALTDHLTYFAHAHSVLANTDIKGADRELRYCIYCGTDVMEIKMRHAKRL